MLPPLRVLGAAQVPLPLLRGSCPPVCSSSLRGSEGWAPPAAAALPGVAPGKTAPAGDLEGKGVQRDAPCPPQTHTLLRAAGQPPTHTQSSQGLSPPPLCTQASIAHPTVHSEGWSAGKVGAAPSGREPGGYTHTHHRRLSERVLDTHRLGRQRERGWCHSSGSGSRGAVSTCACTCRYRPCSWDTCVSHP